ncbi:MAG: hypothetical protein V1720_09175 [bacterium]
MDTHIITEEDIFHFVTSRESLTVEKQNYIKENMVLFKEKIEYYEAFLKPLTSGEEEELKEKIEQKFFSGSKIFVLTPTWNGEQNQTNELRLAAASVILEKKTDSISFADAGQKFLVRIVNKNNRSLLYILPSEQILPNQRYHVKMLPSNNLYETIDLSQPIEISEEDIRQIEIRIISK